MLTGEPPWKEKNLNGLVQLHMLLASWNGPPDYDREVPIELKHCLELCFAKEAEKRPTAVDLLECTFLAEDDLDESANLADQLGFAEPSNDRLNDSGVMLMQQISRAVSRASFCTDKPGGISANSGSGNGHAPKSQGQGQGQGQGQNQGQGQGGGWRMQPVVEDDSTMGGIDRQIMQRERMKAKQREDKDGDRHMPHYQLNMPGRPGGSGREGGYSPFGYDGAGGKDMDSGREDAKRLSPKE
jgi:serine/threonine protein kinase